MATTNKIIKIAITGPESSGKSYTAEFLAREFDGWYVPEYAREYLSQLNEPYNYNDVVNIAYGQLDVENKVIQDAIKEDVKFVFFDCELINTHIWLDEKFGKSEDFIMKAIEQSNYDHYLLMSPDIPWVDDPLRENPNDRNRLFEKYVEYLNHLNKSYTVIKGNYPVRNNLSRAVVSSFVFGND